MFSRRVTITLSVKTFPLPENNLAKYPEGEGGLYVWGKITMNIWLRGMKTCAIRTILKDELNEVSEGKPSSKDHRQEQSKLLHIRYRPLPS